MRKIDDMIIDSKVNECIVNGCLEEIAEWAKFNDVNRPISTLGDTALHIAAANKQYRIATLLIENGATMNKLSPNGFTALDIAFICDDMEMFKLFINHGADVNVTSDDETVAMAALLSQKFDYTEHIFATNRVSADHALSIFKLVISENIIEGLRLLIEHNLHKKVLSNETLSHEYNQILHDALHHAAKEGKCQFIDLFLRCGVNINHLDLMKRTPFMNALNHNKYEAMLQLAHKGANICANIFNTKYMSHFNDGEFSQIKGALLRQYPIKYMKFIYSNHRGQLDITDWEGTLNPEQKDALSDAAMELYKLSTNNRPSLLKLIKLSPNPYIAEWSNGCIDSFIDASTPEVLTKAVRMITNLDKEFIDRLTDLLVSSSMTITEIIHIAKEFDLCFIRVMSSMLSRLHTYESITTEEVLHVTAALQILKARIVVGSQLWKSMLSFSASHPLVTTKLIEQELSFVEHALHMSSETQWPKSDLLHRYWLSLQNMWLCHTISDEDEARLADLDCIWPLHEESSGLRELIRVKRGVSAISLQESKNEITKFVKKFPLWAVVALDEYSELRTVILDLPPSSIFIHQYAHEAVLQNIVFCLKDKQEHMVSQSLNKKFVDMLSECKNGEMLDWQMTPASIGYVKVGFSFKPQLSRKMKSELSRKMKGDVPSLTKDSIHRSFEKLIAGLAQEQSGAEGSVSAHESGGYVEMTLCISMQLLVYVNEKCMTLKPLFSEYVINCVQEKREETLNDYLCSSKIRVFVDKLGRRLRWSNASDMPTLHLKVFGECMQPEKNRLISTIPDLLTAVVGQTPEQVGTQWVNALAETLHISLIIHVDDFSRAKNYASELESTELHNLLVYTDKLLNAMAMHHCENMDVEKRTLDTLMGVYIQVFALRTWHKTQDITLCMPKSLVWKQWWSKLAYLSKKTCIKDGLTNEKRSFYWHMYVALTHGQSVDVKMTLPQWLAIVAIDSVYDKSDHRAILDDILITLWPQCTRHEKNAVLEKRYSLYKEDIRVIQTLPDDMGVISDFMSRTALIRKKYISLPSEHAIPRRLSIWHREKQVYAIRESKAQSIWPHLQRIKAKVLQPRERCDDINEMSFMCCHIWLAAIKLGAKHPVRNRIVHDYVISAFEDGYMYYIKKAYDEITQCLEQGVVLMSSYRYAPTNVPMIRAIDEYMSNNYRRMFMLVYIHEYFNHSCSQMLDATVSHALEHIRHLRNKMAHNETPEDVFYRHEVREHLVCLIRYIASRDGYSEEYSAKHTSDVEKENVSPQSPKYG